MAKTVADKLVERLIGWGVKYVFGLPGDGINGIFEALRTHQDEIRFIQVRHEEAAALAACGYAKYTGGLGVCLATSGPGGIHLLNGLYDAKYDGQPVLAITGHTYHDLIGTHFQQDVNLDKLFMDVALYNERVMGAHHIQSVVDEAIKTALTHRTVSHLTIPKDIQDWDAAQTPRSGMAVEEHSGDLFSPPTPFPAERLLRAAAELVNSGSRVAILAGRGCAMARDEVLELAERVGGPIVTSLLGKGVVPDDSPYTTRGLGLLGTAPSSEAMNQCDTLVMLGSSFPYMEFLPKPGQARCMQVDLDSTRIGLRYPVDVGLSGDCRQVLEALLPMIQRKENRRFLERAQENMRKWRELMEERGTRTDKPMKPQVVAHHLNRFLADDAIIACDTGTVTTWAARYVIMRERMRFAASGMLATMAPALPYSIAAALAYPGRQVVCLAGDGGLSMLLGELATLVKYQLPVKVIVFKNNSLGQSQWEQIVLEGNPHFGTQLQPIDFTGVARACGMAGFYVDDPAQMGSTLEAAFTHPGPALVEAMIDPNEPPMPGQVTVQQAYHFAEAMARGDRSRMGILKTVAENTIREVI